MITKEKVKKEIDKLNDNEVEKVFLYLTSLKKAKTSPSSIRSFRFKGKLDHENLRSLSYE